MATFPEYALALVNGALVAAFDVVFAALAALPPLAGLAIVSVATAAAMLVVVARTSDQPAMAAAKRGIQAGIFEMRLFGDDPRMMLRSFGGVLALNGTYLRLSIAPLLWMALPLVLLIAQLQAFYGYAGLTPGVPALVSAPLRAGGAPPATPLVLEAPPGITVDTGAVRLQGIDEVLWRIVPQAAGSYQLTIRDGSTIVTKTVEVSDRPARRSPVRVAGGVVDQLLYPSEPPVPADGRVAMVRVTYADVAIGVFGWRVHWLIVFGVLSVACAFGMAKRFGVTI